MLTNSSQLPKAIFAVQDEPPNWMPSDVESMSDELIYDDDESEMTDEEGEGVDFEGEAAANPIKPKIDARRLSEDLPLDDNDNDSGNDSGSGNSNATVSKRNRLKARK